MCLPLKFIPSPIHHLEVAPHHRCRCRQSVNWISFAMDRHRVPFLRDILLFNWILESFHLCSFKLLKLSACYYSRARSPFFTLFIFFLFFCYALSNYFQSSIIYKHWHGFILHLFLMISGPQNFNPLKEWNKIEINVFIKCADVCTNIEIISIAAVFLLCSETST